MEPLKRWDILHGDCVQELARFEPSTFDACVTDPPYGEGAAAWDRPRTREWHAAWIAAVDRVLKPGAPLVAFGSRRYLDILMGAMRDVRGDRPGRPLQAMVWAHRQGHRVGDGWLRPEHEPIVVSGLLRVDADEVRACRAYSINHRVNRRPVQRHEGSRGFSVSTFTPHSAGPMAGTVIDLARNKGAEAVGHPTQKPEAVMDVLVKLASQPGGAVVDCFCGSATSGVVALRAGRVWVGCDIRADYVEMGQRRIVADAPLLNSWGELNSKGAR